MAENKNNLEELDSVNENTVSESTNSPKKSTTTKEKKKKPSLIKRFVNFCKDYKSEMKKVVWSPKKDVINNTTTVVCIIAISGVVIGLLDLALTQLVLFLGALI